MKNKPAVSKQQPFPAEQAKDPQLMLRSVTVTQHHSGPLPDPQTLREYRDLEPTAVDRIIRIAESDQAYVQKFNLIEQKGRHRAILLGQVFGFLMGMSAIASCVILLLYDKPLAGSIVFIGAVGTLIATAIWGAKVKEKSSDK